MHVLVPGDWTVRQAHNLAEQIENELRKKSLNASVFTHVEPQGDPTSFQDTSLDRE
jgi:divalent metal cation (Fe/Co/Zn/Cd) transporter